MTEEKMYGKIVGLEIPPVGARRMTIEVVATYQQWDEFRLGMNMVMEKKTGFLNDTTR